MIRTLYAGLEVMLPSGNVVRLVELDGRDWVCEYTERANARGRTVLAARFLRNVGIRVRG